MKAMLEIENMPDSCYDCPCCSIDKQCKAKEHKDIPKVFRGRPEWCPLIVEEPVAAPIVNWFMDELEAREREKYGKERHGD